MIEREREFRKPPKLWAIIGYMNSEYKYPSYSNLNVRVSMMGNTPDVCFVDSQGARRSIHPDSESTTRASSSFEKLESNSSDQNISDTGVN